MSGHRQLAGGEGRAVHVMSLSGAANQAYEPFSHSVPCSHQGITVKAEAPFLTLVLDGSWGKDN